MSDGFITSIKKILLEDAGMSADGVPANSVGGGGVQGIGFGPKGEPGGTMSHRRRKRRAKAQSPALFKALAAEGHVEFDLLSEAGQRRFNEGKSEGAIDARPEIDTDSPDRDPNPRKSKKRPSKLSLRRGPDASIEIDPILPTRFESYESRRERPTQKCDYLCKIGLAGDDLKHLTWYRTVLKDPDVCINNASMRPVAANVLNRILDLVFDDPVLYNRIRLRLLAHREHEQFEDVDDELARYAAWKEQSDFAEAYESTPIAVLQHQMASEPDPGRKARLAQEIRRRTGKTQHRTQLRVGGNR
jgi:hypothetical protein